MEADYTNCVDIELSFTGKLREMNGLNRNGRKILGADNSAQFYSTRLSFMSSSLLIIQ